GTIGSSAGGEQPKFLVTRTPGARPALVKFSPSTKTGVGRRSADLLVAEHLALEVLAKHGKPAAKSELVAAGEQIFLEVERFDRTPQGGRRGLISLLALDAEFVGRMVSWTDSVSRLVDNQILPRAMIRNVAWLELFGRLIANSDMHAGNLSFFARGSRVLGIAPAYDMLPAQYAGQQGHLAEVTFEPAPPKPADSDVWNEASGAALELWQRVLKHELVSADFRGIARHNAKVVEAFRDAGRLLPAPR
ncbi:MAG TPA: HipA domain-containing protein, partial [Polyangiaceae bacterium]